ncbi:MAG: hypothetical protein E6J41_13060 [Chloroflexi bacterium]|nr:MAG: hypothetical protein E6J41_13060 [Chloroflexota bacterium]
MSGSSPARLDRRAAPASAPDEPPLVVGVFDDEVRAEQAVRALEVWRHANRGGGIQAVGVVSRGVSGTVTWRARGVTRPRRAALVGLVAGAVLFGLPAAGAAGLAGWVAASVVLGLAGLVGAVPAAAVGGLVVGVALAAAALAGLLAGLAGAVIGCLVGLLVGFIDQQVRGFHRPEVAFAADSLPPGGWAAVARAQPVTEPAVRAELVRLGGVPCHPALPPDAEPA